VVIDLLTKRWELLREALPVMRRIGAGLKASKLGRAGEEKLLEDLADKAGIELRFFYADVATDYSAATAAMRAAGVEALLIGNDPQFFADAPSPGWRVRLVYPPVTNGHKWREPVVCSAMVPTKALPAASWRTMSLASCVAPHQQHCQSSSRLVSSSPLTRPRQRADGVRS
jgi:hypothetical protein